MALRYKRGPHAKEFAFLTNIFLPEKNDFALKMIFFFPEKKFMQVQTTEDILNSYFGEEQLSYHF